jgi:hypothetical protein
MSATVEDWLLDSTFAALADPTRRAILARLARGNASVGELAQPFEFALPTISGAVAPPILQQVPDTGSNSRMYCQVNWPPGEHFPERLP